MRITEINTLERAIMHYGEEAQKDKAIEELAELIRALSRDNDLDNISEEMADVYIMMVQLELIYANTNDIKHQINAKTERLQGRMNSEMGICYKIF